MTRYAPFALAGLVLLSSAALASPQIPTPANPYPDEPVATDGTPLKPTFGSRARDGFNALSTQDAVLRGPRVRRHR